MQERIEKILNSEKFKTIGEHKLMLIKNFMQKAEGRSLNEMGSELISLYAAINSDGKISEEERKMLLELIMESLDEREKEQVRKVLKMLGA